MVTLKKKNKNEMLKPLIVSISTLLKITLIIFFVCFIVPSEELGTEKLWIYHHYDMFAFLCIFRCSLLT